MFYSLRPEIRLNIKAPSIEEFPISPPLSHHHSGGGGGPGRINYLVMHAVENCSSLSIILDANFWLVLIARE